MPTKTPKLPSTGLTVPSLRVSATDAKSKVAERIAQGEILIKTWRENGARLGDDECERQCTAWDEHNKTTLMSLFDGSLFLDQYRRQQINMGIIDVEGDPGALIRSLISVMLDKNSRLQSILNQIDMCSVPTESAAGATTSPTSIERLVRICRRFPLVARQLKRRHNNRAPFTIDDEYDVQDLIHALLWLEFDDVRAEAWTPSYAGKSSRMDFLLKRERLVLETKMTRDGLGLKEIGYQLIIDIDRYKEHQDCRALVCFVFDPERRIANPAELEDDLSGPRDSLDVHLIVSPRE